MTGIKVIDTLAHLEGERSCSPSTSEIEKNRGAGALEELSKISFKAHCLALIILK